MQRDLRALIVMGLEAIVSAVTGFVGLLFLFGAWKEWRRRPDPAHVVMLEGEVVELTTPFAHRRDGRRLVVAPVVSYRTAEGEVKRFTSALAQYPNPYVVGETVAVRQVGGPYPSVDLAAAGKRLDAGWIMSLVLGLAFCGVSIGVQFLDRLPS